MQSLFGYVYQVPMMGVPMFAGNTTVALRARWAASGAFHTFTRETISFWAFETVSPQSSELVGFFFESRISGERARREKWPRV